MSSAGSAPPPALGVLSFAELFEAGDVSMTSTTATTDAQIRTLTQKLAAASQNVLKLEREATTAEGAIRDLRSQLAAARAAASRPVTVESPRPPPIDPARLAALEQELQSERRRREEVEDELRQLQAQKRSPPRPPPPRVIAPSPCRTAHAPSPCPTARAPSPRPTVRTRR